MTNSTTAGLAPPHPGELLREDILPAVPHSRVEIARLLGISRQQLYDILKERKPVTSRTALRLAKMFGGSPETWLRLQQRYDLVRERAAIAEELAAIPSLLAA